MSVDLNSMSCFYTTCLFLLKYLKNLCEGFFHDARMIVFSLTSRKKIKPKSGFFYQKWRL